MTSEQNLVTNLLAYDRAPYTLPHQTRHEQDTWQNKRKIGQPPLSTNGDFNFHRQQLYCYIHSLVSRGGMLNTTISFKQLVPYNYKRNQPSYIETLKKTLATRSTVHIVFLPILGNQHHQLLIEPSSLLPKSGSKPNL